MQSLTGIFDDEKEEWILPPMFREVGDKNGEVYLLFPALSDYYDYDLDEDEKSENQKALEKRWGELDKAIFLVNTAEETVISLDKANRHHLSSDSDSWKIDYKNKVIFHWNYDERTCLMNFEGQAILDDTFLEYQAYPSFFVGYFRDEYYNEIFNIYGYDGEIIFENVKGYAWQIQENKEYYIFEVRDEDNTSNILLFEDKYIGIYDEIYNLEKDFVFVKNEGKHHVIDVKTNKSIYTSDYGIESFSIEKDDFQFEYMCVKHSMIRDNLSLLHETTE